MNSRLFAAVLITGLAALNLSFPVEALTSKECSAKFKAAQAAGTAGNVKYADFRKAECGTGTSTASSPRPPAPAPATMTRVEPIPAPQGGARSPTTPPTSQAVFPNAISARYSSETAGKQRMHTCLDQYNANKANNANAGLKWIEKGGGYYSQCNARLKG
jgi:hypothetical protein